MDNTILGGATLWARQTIESDIFFYKPDKWFKIWFFIVNKVNHSDTKLFERGSNLMTYGEISKSTKATENQIDMFMRWAKKEQMLTTQKTTRGMIVTILNYDKFQTLENYKTDTLNELQTKRKRNGNDTINKNDKYDKNEKNDNIYSEFFSSELMQRFLNHRKGKRAPIKPDSYKLFYNKFKAWEEKGFSPEFVVNTIIEKGWQSFDPDWIKNGGNNGKSKGQPERFTEAGYYERSN